MAAMTDEPGKTRVEILLNGEWHVYTGKALDLEVSRDPVEVADGAEYRTFEPGPRVDVRLTFDAATFQQEVAAAPLERELTRLRRENELGQANSESLQQRLAVAERELTAAREVVEGIDPDKLDLLADWFDQDDANKGRDWQTGSPPEVQADLRRWARLILSLRRGDV